MAPAVIRHEELPPDLLLARFQPDHPDWDGSIDQWIFRGQADATWPLLPTAHRDESWVDFPGYEQLRRVPRPDVKGGFAVLDH